MRGPGPAGQPACAYRAHHRHQGVERVAQRRFDGVGVSALSSSSPKSACAFPMISNAVFVLANSASSRTFCRRSRSASTSAQGSPSDSARCPVDGAAVVGMPDCLLCPCKQCAGPASGNAGGPPVVTDLVRPTSTADGQCAGPAGVEWNARGPPVVTSSVRPRSTVDERCVRAQSGWNVCWPPVVTSWYGRVAPPCRRRVGGWNAGGPPVVTSPVRPASNTPQSAAYSFPPFFLFFLSRLAP